MSPSITQAYGFVRERLRAAVGPRSDTMLALLAPPKGQPVVVRVVILGAALGGIATMGLLAGGATLVLLLALGGIYWLVTEVLGLELSVDPRAAYEAFVQQAQRRS